MNIDVPVVWGALMDDAERAAVLEQFPHLTPADTESAYWDLKEDAPGPHLAERLADGWIPVVASVHLTGQQPVMFVTVRRP